MKQGVEYEKRERLIEAAKVEFQEKGYNKASLRNICARAGVTTGALYFFFEGKADLFAEIVNGPIEGMKAMLVKHFQEDRAYMEQHTSIEEIDMDHSELSDMLVDYTYRNYDSFMLLITASENTVYENFVDDFVRLIESSIPIMLSGMPGYTYDPYLSHWMSHISVDAFLHLIQHERDVNEAKRKLRPILNYLIRGWVELVMEEK